MSIVIEFCLNDAVGINDFEEFSRTERIRLGCQTLCREDYPGEQKGKRQPNPEAFGAWTAVPFGRFLIRTGCISGTRFFRKPDQGNQDDNAQEGSGYYRQEK